MKKAVLFIHGFSAQVEDNSYFIETMKKHKLIDIHTFILPGHEQRRMGKVKYQDWIQASEVELNKLLAQYSKVTIVAHSMGTILAINLASRYPEVIEKLVLISPAYLYGNTEQNRRDFKKLLKLEIDPTIGTGFEGALHKLINVPFPRFLEYRKLVKANAENIPKVVCPTLILHGTIDNIVPIRSSLYIYNYLHGEKHLTLIEDVRHQVFKSHKKDIITKYIYEYILGGVVFKIKMKDMI